MSVKLTDRQQEVVNLMAAGWKMHFSYAIGNFMEASCDLSYAGNDRKVPVNVPDQLKRKGLVIPWADSHHGCFYNLTDLGKSLAKPIDKPKLTKWWRSGYAGIDSSEFVSETAEYLLRGDGRTVKKAGGYERGFATREEAVTYRLRELERVVKSSAADLRDAERELAKFRKQLAKFRKTEGV
jgi:hypothetical protein